jgi:SAM-dependent methyltransferase
VLNVGGGSNRSLPARYSGWEQFVLDIDPAVSPEICCDALEMEKHVEKGSFDAVYCSHNLEHFYWHDVPKVLEGFLHALKRGGFADIAVPNLNELMRDMLSRSLDIHDIWYRSPSGPITYHDVLYGFGRVMKEGNLFYSHKCGFTAMSMVNVLLGSGFSRVEINDSGGNITALAYKD